MVILYSQIMFQLKKGDDLEIYETDFTTNKELNDSANLKQPFIFSFSEFDQNLSSLDLTKDYGSFDVFVKDDHITIQDRIDIWFGSPWSDFSDYIVGEKNKKTFIFRNSAESGDEANLQRFIQDADYPKGKLKNAESGLEIKPIVPQANNLKREYIFNGITRFEFSSNQSIVKQLDLDKYKPLENQLGMKLDDLSSFTKYHVSKTDSGLHYRIAMHNKCLGFARAVKMNEIRYVIDIIDGDPDETSEQIISSTSNRFYGRPYYFNKINLPFASVKQGFKVENCCFNVL
jgi:hypothetical protein